MNKLYLLAALGISTIEAGSYGWYAGDCLMPMDFAPTYGFVVFDCGSECASSGPGPSVDDYGGLNCDECEVDGKCGFLQDDDTAVNNDYGYDYYGEYNTEANPTPQICVAFPDEYSTGDIVDEYTYDDEDYYADYYGDYYYSAKVEKKLKQSSTGYLFEAGINFKGLDEIDSDVGIYCNHYHMYSFQYGNA